MILDTFKNLDSYKGIHPGVWKGLELLRDTDFSAMEDVRVEVDGANLFYFIQSYDTKPVNDTPEAHIEYIDIQCVISGKESMGVGPLETMTEEVLPRPDGDIRFYRGPVDYVTLVPGNFAVLFPGDAHSPCIAIGAPAPVRKVVVKVKV